MSQSISYQTITCRSISVWWNFMESSSLQTSFPWVKEQSRSRMRARSRLGLLRSRIEDSHLRLDDPLIVFEKPLATQLKHLHNRKDRESRRSFQNIKLNRQTIPNQQDKNSRLTRQVDASRGLGSSSTLREVHGFSYGTFESPLLFSHRSEVDTVAQQSSQEARFIAYFTGYVLLRWSSRWSKSAV